MDIDPQPAELARRTPRSAKHSEAGELYRCQCGKDYLTFSALYLHVNLKHGQRLSTRRTEFNQKTQTTNGKTIVTYFFEENENINQNQYNNHNKQQRNPSNLQPTQKNNTKIAIIRQYLQNIRNQMHREELPYSILENVMNSFIEYFKCIDQLVSMEGGQEQERDVTEYFNQFSTYYMPLVQKQMFCELGVVIKVLNSFYRWLKQHKHTRMQLICHHAYEQHARSRQQL